jgi:hypothetical protein
VFAYFSSVRLLPVWLVSLLRRDGLRRISPSCRSCWPANPCDGPLINQQGFYCIAFGSSVPRIQNRSCRPLYEPQLRPAAFHLPSTPPAEIDPQMSPHLRVLSFAELKRLKHINWNEEYIAQLVGAGLFPAPIRPGTWRESHIDDWIKARKAKGDLSWRRFLLKQPASHVAAVGRRD